MKLDINKIISDINNIPKKFLKVKMPRKKKKEFKKMLRTL